LKLVIKFVKRKLLIILEIFYRRWIDVESISRNP
jgi:hypothetical protein